MMQVLFRDKNLQNYIINSSLPRTVNQWNNLPESVVLTPSFENF